MSATKKPADSFLSEWPYVNELDSDSFGSSMNVLKSSIKAKAVPGVNVGFRHPVTYRMSAGNYVNLEAIGNNSNLSRNELLDQIVTIGFAYFIDSLDDKARVLIHDAVEHESVNLAKSITKGSGVKNA